MATYQRGKYWWYRFRFAGERIDEPTKSTSRTVAKEAERQNRRALEAGYNNFKEVRQNRVRILEEIIVLTKPKKTDEKLQRLLCRLSSLLLRLRFHR